MLFEIMLRSQTYWRALSRGAWLLGPAESSPSALVSWSPVPFGTHAAHSSAPAMAVISADTPKAPSAYKLFMTDFAKATKGDKVPMNFFTRASAEFKSLPEAERKRYEDQAAVLKASAAAQRAEAKRQAAEEKVAAKHAAAETKVARQGKYINAYSAFVKARYQAVRTALPEGAPTTETFQKLAETWRAMSFEERSAFGKLKPRKAEAEKSQG